MVIVLKFLVSEKIKSRYYGCLIFRFTKELYEVLVAILIKVVWLKKSHCDKKKKIQLSFPSKGNTTEAESKFEPRLEKVYKII